MKNIKPQVISDKQLKSDVRLFLVFGAVLLGWSLKDFFSSLSVLDTTLISIITGSILFILGCISWTFFSASGRKSIKNHKRILELPKSLRTDSHDSVYMGQEVDLGIRVNLPDSIRSRHVHILGATGSGKTESVILNFLKQDVARGLGSIILDAKGDASFLNTLNKCVPKSRLKVFDLASEDSLTYNPLEAGISLEAAQRLFISLTWSEEYYKSKAFSSLQRLFQNFHEVHGRNPTLKQLSDLLEDPDSYSVFTTSENYPKKLAEKDFFELSGLRDQLKTLSIGALERILSPKEQSDMRLEEAAKGTVLYFRLQSLLSAQLVTILGKLIINHLNYLAGTAHRNSNSSAALPLVPTYLDEFASFASPEFADLISKARSARFALHFSHQSVGDLSGVAEGFLNKITDNSATKIVLRINDPDSADFFARSFGTKLYQKVTQRITKSKEEHTAEVVGEGSQREAHQFRASPDLLKTLPTGTGSVLIAHGEDTPEGASCVLKIKFPQLKEEQNHESEPKEEQIDPANSVSNTHTVLRDNE